MAKNLRHGCGRGTIAPKRWPAKRYGKRRLNQDVLAQNILEKKTYSRYRFFAMSLQSRAIFSFSVGL
jgi:hypothetical protein